MMKVACQEVQGKQNQHTHKSKELAYLSAGLQEDISLRQMSPILTAMSHAHFLD
jgi:hypothetical protein